jgi:predicted small lipoprotein YifL
MRYSFPNKALLAVFLSLVVLSSCGQKRALYLPEEPASNSPKSQSKELNQSEEEN